MDDELKREYINLRSGLYKVKHQFDNTTLLHSAITQKLKKGLYVDKNIIYSSNLSHVFENLNSIKSNINNEISSINYKL